jgi:hypothetical protein
VKLRARSVVTMRQVAWMRWGVKQVGRQVGELGVRVTRWRRRFRSWQGAAFGRGCVKSQSGPNAEGPS